MNKSCDRFSELPDSIIFEIFWLLSMTDVVRTTVLSKRWKDLWTTLPFLNFEDSDSRYSSWMEVEEGENRLRDFVNRALILWRGIKIVKFKINMKSQYSRTFDDDFDVWIRFAKEKAAEEIYIHVMNDCEPYQLPECLYSCSSLQVLVLSLYYIQLSSICGHVKWDRLKCLTINSKYFYLDPHLISQILGGSPNLEVFVLSLYRIDKSLSIRSTSLRKLVIRKYYDERDRELKIETPNLETLDMSGFTYRKFWVDASSLSDVNLRFKEGSAYECGETLSQILPVVQHVDRVRISTWCIKALQITEKENLLSPFLGSSS